MYTYQLTVKYNESTPQSAEMWQLFGHLMTTLFNQKELEFVSDLKHRKFGKTCIASLVVQANWSAIVKLYTLCKSAYFGLLVEQVFQNHAGQWTYASTIFDSYEKALVW